MLLIKVISLTPHVLLVLQQFLALDTFTFYYMPLIHLGELFSLLHYLFIVKPLGTNWTMHMQPRKRPHFCSRAYKTLSSSISDALHLDESSTIQPEPLTKPAKLQVTGLAWLVWPYIKVVRYSYTARVTRLCLLSWCTVCRYRLLFSLRFRWPYATITYRAFNSDNDTT